MTDQFGDKEEIEFLGGHGCVVGDILDCIFVFDGDGVGALVIEIVDDERIIVRCVSVDPVPGSGTDSS